MSVDDNGLRAHFPELTEETRKKISKIAKEKHEQARIALRNERDKARSQIQDKQKANDLSENEADGEREKVQEVIDTANKILDELYKEKHTKIMGT